MFLILILYEVSNLWILLHFFGGIFRKMEEQKPKEQRPKASENKPIMTEWYLLGLSCFKRIRMLDVLRTIIKVGYYLFKPWLWLTWIWMLIWFCNGLYLNMDGYDFAFEHVMVSAWIWMFFWFFNGHSSSLKI